MRMLVENIFIGNRDMSSMSTSRAKKIDPLSKKIPENPKYKHVRPTVDTGASLTKYMAKIDDIKQNYKYRKDEIFKRMKLTTFVQLVIQVYHISEDDFQFGDVPATPSDSGRPDTGDAELQKLQSGGSPVPSLALTDGDFGHEPDTSRSTLLSVAQGVGELDLEDQSVPVPPTPASHKQNEMMDETCPYLLLDVRDNDAYNECRIISARNYPKAELSKACNYESRDMLKYKNVAGRIIVIVDEDERIAPNAATTLVQRGYDNIFMLSGGLKVANKLFPEGLITGTVPQVISGVKTKMITPASQDYFTVEDINRLEIYLDNALQDHSIGSRLSNASTASSRMSTSRSSASTTRSATSVKENRPAFR